MGEPGNADFVMCREDDVEILVRTELQAQLVPVLRAATRDWQGMPVRMLKGGRGATVAVDLGTSSVAVRAGRRGGLPGRVLSDVYFGLTPRCFGEIEVLASLRDRGVPVVEPLAAAAQWLGPVRYRSWVATHYIEDALTLWGWLGTEQAPEQRRDVLQCAGRAIAALHYAGGHHPDLNANNLLVHQNEADELSVLLIDFDRVRSTARFGAARRDLARLRRSFRKLDPAAVVISDQELDALDAAHAGASF